MSNYLTTAIDKATGEERGCCVYDNYFGKGQWGYRLSGDKDVLTQKLFDMYWKEA